MQRQAFVNLPYHEIKKTIQTKPEILRKTDAGNAEAHLKEFDRYFILSIVNTRAKKPEIDLHIKLPRQFAEKHNSSFRNLLDEFLKITGVSHNGKSIVDFDKKRP